MDSDSQPSDRPTDPNWPLGGDPSRMWLSAPPGAPQDPFTKRDAVSTSISFIVDCDRTPDRHTRNREFVDKDGRAIEHLIYCSRCLTKTHMVDAYMPAKVDFLTATEAQSSADAVLDLYHRTELSSRLMGLLWTAHQRFQQYADAKHRIEQIEREESAKKKQVVPWVVSWDGLEIGEVEAVDVEDAWKATEQYLDLRKRDI